MRFFLRNLHVYVFAFFSVLASVWVANHPDETVQLMRPLVEDAVEVSELVEGAYREVSRLDWQETSEEAVSLFVATMRMPTMLFERLAERLEEVEQDMQRRSRAEASEPETVDLAEEAGLQLDGSGQGRAGSGQAQSPEI